MNIMESTKKALLATSITVIAAAGLGTSAQTVLAAEAKTETSAKVGTKAAVKEPTQEVKDKAELTKEDADGVEMKNAAGDVKYIHFDYALEYYTDYGYDLTKAGNEDLKNLNKTAYDKIVKDKTPAPTNKAPIKVPGKNIGNHEAMIGDWSEVKVVFSDYYKDPDGDKLKFTVKLDKAGKEENVYVYDDHLILYSNNTGKTTVTIKVDDGKGGVLTDSFVYNVIPDPTAPDIDPGDVSGNGNGNNGVDDDNSNNGSGNGGNTDDGGNSGSGNGGDSDNGGNTGNGNTDDDSKDPVEDDNNSANTDKNDADKDNTKNPDKNDATKDDKVDDKKETTTTTVVKDNGTNKDTLPQTGSESTGLTTAIGLGLLAIASFFGIRRKR